MRFRNLLFVCLAAGLFLAAGDTRAAVVPFDISPDLAVQPAGAIAGGNLIGSPFTYYNIQFDVDGGVPDINIRTARADAPGGPGVDQVVSDGFNGSSILTKGENSYINTPFALGDMIGDGIDEFVRDPDGFSVINDGGYQLFAEGSNFLGFKLPSGSYGYVHVLYESASSTYTFTGGAYDAAGGPIAAGAVPEPASWLIACGCLGWFGFRRVRRGM
jgi:hypothetical protein